MSPEPTESTPAEAVGPPPLPVESLRWRCPAEDLPFETTADLEPMHAVVGQHSALEALRFGLECRASGQNVFVRGITGTGRMTTVRRLLDDLKPKCDAKQDRCYVHNFGQPERPRLVSLPAGRGRAFRRSMEDLAAFVKAGLGEALASEAVRARIAPLEERQRARLEAAGKPFEEELRGANLALVSLQLGPTMQMAIFPRVEGKPIQPEQFEAMHSQGKVSDEQYAAWRENLQGFTQRLEELGVKVAEIRREGAKAIRAVLEETTRKLVREVTDAIRAEHPAPEVAAFLDEVEAHVVETRLSSADGGADPSEVYGVNVVHSHEPGDDAPIVVEHVPTLAKLLGTVEREWSPEGGVRSSYAGIRGGSLLRADGGYLVLDARDVLGEPGAWKMLLRTLRSGLLEIVPSELTGFLAPAAVKPEPIPVKIRVVLLGDSSLYYLLDAHEPEFSNLFKVLADFDTVIDRAPAGPAQYAGVLANVARSEGLLPFHKTGVAALVEHGARIAARHGKLSARFSRVADLAREAAFLAERAGEPSVGAERVVEAVRRTRERADLPSRRFQELLREGTIHVQTSGAVVGQVNGLAVIQAGPLTYGFPARITATIGPGTAGLINIEGHAQLSGSIHTKGFAILGGLLRHLLKPDHPLAFSASLAFEQSYGGIDGDSASGAEICCLLSALTDVPIRQDLAITGAIDQKGHLQAVGGVNEKIEGFYDTCCGAGLTGTQGVVVPRANAGDLMLRPDVVEACARGEFRVFGAGTIQEALELLTGRVAGEHDEDEGYPEDSLLGTAVAMAEAYWLMSLRSPTVVMEEAAEEPAEEPPRAAESR